MSPSRNISTKKFGGDRNVVAISSPQVIPVERVAINVGLEHNGDAVASPAVSDQPAVQPQLLGWRAGIQTGILDPGQGGSVHGGCHAAAPSRAETAWPSR